MKIILLCLALIPICTSVYSSESTFFEANKTPGTGSRQRGKDLKNSHERQVKDNFAAHLIITSDKTVFSRWNTPSEVFSFKSSSTIMKGEVFFPLFVYWNPQKDFTKITRVTYVLEILKPDGTIYAKENLEAGEGVVNHDKAMLVKNYLAVTIEDKDPLGTYKVTAHIRDEVSRNDLTLSSQFEVVERVQKKESQVSQQELSNFVSYFYKGDKVEEFLKVLKYSDKIPGWYDRGTVWMHFLSEVFKKYPDKLSSWYPAFKELSITGKQTVWDALWWSHTNKSLALLQQIHASSNNSDKKYIDTLLKSKFVPLAKIKISAPGDLDNNWAGFMASGNDVFVTNIINEIKPNTGRSGIELQVIASARWSLISNCQQHPRVLAITERAFVNEDDLQKKKILEEIVLEGRKPISR